MQRLRNLCLRNLRITHYTLLKPPRAEKRSSSLQWQQLARFKLWGWKRVIFAAAALLFWTQAPKSPKERLTFIKAWWRKNQDRNKPTNCRIKWRTVASKSHLLRYSCRSEKWSMITLNLRGIHNRSSQFITIFKNRDAQWRPKKVNCKIMQISATCKTKYKKQIWSLRCSRWQPLREQKSASRKPGQSLETPFQKRKTMRWTVKSPS